MSRTGSRQGAQRGAWDRSAPTSPKPAAAQAIARTTSSSGSARSPSGSGVTRTTSGAGTTRSPSQANVRPAFSFANAAGGKPKEGEAAKEGEDSTVESTEPASNAPGAPAEDPEKEVTTVERAPMKVPDYVHVRITADNLKVGGGHGLRL